MNLIQQKIAKMGKLVSIVLFVACTLTALTSLLLLVVMGILIFSNGSLSSSLQDIFTITSSVGSIEMLSTQNLVILFLLAVIQLIILLGALSILYRIFSDISHNYTPFEKKQVTRMKQVAILTFVLCISSNIFTWIASVLLRETTILSLDVMWLGIAVVIYCIAHIFDYGYQLQTQSDETL
jgi:hypothetical protein